LIHRLRCRIQLELLLLASSKVVESRIAVRQPYS
jgi:hypothetical protein